MATDAARVRALTLVQLERAIQFRHVELIQALTAAYVALAPSRIVSVDPAEPALDTEALVAADDTTAWDTQQRDATAAMRAAERSRSRADILASMPDPPAVIDDEAPDASEVVVDDDLPRVSIVLSACHDARAIRTGARQLTAGDRERYPMSRDVELGTEVPIYSCSICGGESIGPPL